MGDQRPERVTRLMLAPQARARDTRLAHDRRPWETTGPKRVTPTRPQLDHGPKRATPARQLASRSETMRERHPPGPNGPNCAHDRRPWETTVPEARDTHPAPIGPNCALIGDCVGEHRPERVTPARPQCPQFRSPWDRRPSAHPAPMASIALIIGEYGRPQAPKRVTPTRPQWPQLCS